MRLLDKRDIAREKAQEHKFEIDEGVKLAQKIDTLRETASKEESNLKKFRDKTLEIVKGEIESLIQERDSLRLEVNEKREERLKLEAPVELKAELKKIENDRKQLSTLQSSLLDRETNLIARELAVANLKDREGEVLKKEKEAKEYLSEAQKSYQKIENIRADIEASKAKVDLEVENKHRELNKKFDDWEQSILSRELKISQDLKFIEKERKEILDTGSVLIQRESKLNSDTQELNRRIEEVSQKEIATENYRVEASKNYDVSERLKKQVQKWKTEEEEQIKKRLLDVSNQEKDLGYRERDLILQKEQVEFDKKEIEKEKIHIASQQQTLKVAWNNIKKLSNK